MVEIDEISKKFLHKEDALIIATVGVKGNPNIAGFYFMYHEEEGVIYILTRPNILTIRNIQRKPEVALLVIHTYKDDWKNQHVMIQGVAENVEDEETIEKVKAMRIKKYHWQDEETFLARRGTWAVIRVKPSYFRSFIRARDTIFPELRPPEHSHW
jgi:general stress protein 26